MYSNSNKTSFSFLFSLFLLWSCTIEGQADFQFGALPEINLTFSTGKDYKINGSIQSTLIFSSTNSNPELDFSGLKYDNSEYTINVVKSLLRSSSFGLGLELRDKLGTKSYRFIQRFTITKPYYNLRTSHRLMADQHFFSNDVTIFRFRYRFTAQKALSGQNVDTKEFYLKYNQEFLFSIDKNNEDLEFRFVPLLGYQLKNHNKLELGFDYRLSELFDDSPLRHRLWTRLTWYYTFEPKATHSLD